MKLHEAVLLLWTTCLQLMPLSPRCAGIMVPLTSLIFTMLGHLLSNLFIRKCRSLHLQRCGRQQAGPLHALFLEVTQLSSVKAFV